MEIILTGRKVPAAEALQIGMCEQVVARRQTRATTQAMAHQMARFPQAAVRADRRTVHESHGLSLREGMRVEWHNGVEAHHLEGAEGAARFAGGLGRSGDFSAI